MIEKNINLKEFVDLIRGKIQSNNNFHTFNENINHYDMSLGGCGCSRKTREKYADDKFSEKITKLDESILLEVKQALGFNSDDIISFINKDGALIKKV